MLEARTSTPKEHTTYMRTYNIKVIKSRRRVTSSFIVEIYYRYLENGEKGTKTISSGITAQSIKRKFYNLSWNWSWKNVYCIYDYKRIQSWNFKKQEKNRVSCTSGSISDATDSVFSTAKPRDILRIRTLT